MIRCNGRQSRPKVIYEWAFQTRAKEFANVNAGEGVRSAVARGFPVVFSMAVPAVCYSEAATSCVIRASTPQEDAVGRLQHAMLIVGYDLHAREYIIRNSWGAAWGDKGYCRMSFPVMDNYASTREYWILGNLGQNEGGTRSVQPAETAAESQSVTGLASTLREEIRASLTKDIEAATKDIEERFRKK